MVVGTYQPGATYQEMDMLTSRPPSEAVLDRWSKARRRERIGNFIFGVCAVVGIGFFTFWVACALAFLAVR